MSLGEKLLKKVHFLVFAYTAFSLFQSYMTHVENTKNLEGSLPMMKARNAKLKEKIELAESFKKNVEEIKSRLLDVATDIEKSQRQLPASIKDSDVSETINNEADIIKIIDLSLTPGKEVNRDFYYSKDYQLQASGTFLQFLVYFERLLANSRIINVLDLEMERGQKSRRRGSFQVVNLKSRIEVFRYDPNFKEDAGLLDLEKPDDKKDKNKVPKA